MNLGRRTLIGIPYLWLLLLFLVPFGIILKISLSDIALAIPPYTPTLDLSEGWQGIRSFFAALDFENYIFLTEDDLYWRAYLSSLKIAFISTLLALAVGFPIAYGMANAASEWRPTLMMLVILPFWTSFLIRVYAWIGILKPEGLLNQFLLWLGMIDEPLIILNTHTAIFIGIVYSYLPFMVLPLYAAFEKLDTAQVEAAQDLYAKPTRAFWHAVFPQTLPGLLAGIVLVAIPAFGMYVIPELLGGGKTMMIGNLIGLQFGAARNWPFGAALGLGLLAFVLIAMTIYAVRIRPAQEGQR